MGKHNRNRGSKYVGRHRATYVAQHDLGKKATGVLALSAILSLTPAVLGYEVVENGITGMGISAPPGLLEEMLGEVIPEPAPEPPVELDAPW